MTPELLIAAEKRHRELGINSRSQWIQMLMRRDIIEGGKDFVISGDISSLGSDSSLPSEYKLEQIKKESHRLPPAALKVLERAEAEIDRRKAAEAEEAEAAKKKEAESKKVINMPTINKSILNDPEEQAKRELPQNNYGAQYQKTATKYYLKQAKITDPDQLEKFFSEDRDRLFPADREFGSLEEAIETAVIDASSSLSKN